MHVLFHSQGKGVYSYVGVGDRNVGQLRTRQPLAPRTHGPSSLEITIIDTGMNTVKANTTHSMYIRIPRHPLNLVYRVSRRIKGLKRNT